MAAVIRVALVARTLPVRAGLRALLDDDVRFRVVGEFPSVDSIDPGTREETQVLLLDGEALSMLATVPTETLPGLVILGGGTALRSELLKLGDPVGLLNADVSSEQINAAIVAVAAGLTVTEPGAVGSMGTALRMDDDEFDQPELTSREREVLELVAAGLPNKGIALRLNISDHTVKYHLASVLSKLGAASRAEAVALAARRGLIAL
jgi:DNA-binding NarL/FixJ family response regulator